MNTPMTFCILHPGDVTPEFRMLMIVSAGGDVIGRQ